MSVQKDFCPAIEGCHAAASVDRQLFESGSASKTSCGNTICCTDEKCCTGHKNTATASSQEALLNSLRQREYSPWTEIGFLELQSTNLCLRPNGGSNKNTSMQPSRYGRRNLHAYCVSIVPVKEREPETEGQIQRVREPEQARTTHAS